MYSQFGFSSKKQAHRCVRYCSNFGVVAEILPYNRFYEGAAQVRVSNKFSYLVRDAFAPFIVSSLVEG